MMGVVRKLSRYLQGKRLALVLAFLLLLSLNLITTNIVVADNPCPNSWNITLQGLKSTYTRGETINVSASYSIRNHSLSPGTIQQILVGIIDENRQVYDVTCLYNGSANVCPQETTGNANFTLTCPSSPGTYQILASNYQLYSCEDAKRIFPKNPASDKVMATIQVSGPMVAASPNNTVTTPSVTPSVTLPIITPTNWNNPITAITSWWQQNQKTIFSVIALILLVYVGLKYLINKKLNGLDILLLAVAVLAILIIYVIPFILLYWVAILISVAVLIVVAVIALQKGWIQIGSGTQGSTALNIPTAPLSTIEKGIVFENQCINLLGKMGFQCEPTKKTGDNGIDIRAHSSKPFTEGLYVVQCKDWDKKPVGEQEVRNLYGVVRKEKANKGILITSSYFTAKAIQWAQGENIELIDGERLNQIINEHK